MSLTLFSKDALRTSVEAASGGKVTVMYDDRGYPSFMCVIPRFNVEDIDADTLGTGVHPAFVVNGVEKSEIFIGQYPAIVQDSRAISIPGMAPRVSIDFDSARNACAAKGSGWHLMTNAEWSALALWCWKNGFQPRGNTNWGRAHNATYETARRVDGVAPGTASGNGANYTGSGPVGWRHDNTWAGIADLVGNVWEWNAGMRVNNGEIQIIPYNDAAADGADHAVGSSLWKAVKEDGSLVAPGTTGTLKYDSATPGTTGTVGVAKLNTEVVNSNDPGTGTDDGSTSTEFQALTANVAVTAPNILKQLLMFPHKETGLNGRLYVRNYGERLPIRGGHWGGGSVAGLFYLDVNNGRSHSNSGGIGFRPAFVS